ncbi:hypothetical protein [Actinoplanes sp. NPDC026619]|uniref:hypothetical protein n=1 Tax=Actinoplanes sp. NPDC026619 TaxID=3155798 RepID=UPI0033D099FC
MPSDPHPFPQRRLLALLTAGAAIVIILAGVAVAVRDSATTPSAAADKVIGPPLRSSPEGSGGCRPPDPFTLSQLRSLVPTSSIAPTVLGQEQSAREHLRALATAVTTGPCDTAGRYDYVQTRQWALDARTSDGATSQTATVLQYESWLAADGSGRNISITTRTPPTENPPTDDIYPPGASPATWVPLPTDVGAAATMLGSATTGGRGPQARLSAVADLNQQQSPPRATRAALLTALSDTDAITYHDPVTDRAGRHGVAVAATSNDGITRDLLIIDPATGTVLAYEQAALGDPGRLGITTPRVLSYKLYLGRDHTDTVQRR